MQSPARSELSTRLAGFPLFDGAEYARANPDAGSAPLAHAVDRGLREGRPLARPEWVAGVLGRLAQKRQAPPPTSTASRMAPALSRMAGARVSVFASPRSQSGAEGWASALVAQLNALGASAEAYGPDGGFAAPGSLRILVAPWEHEADPVRPDDEVVGSSFVVTGEGVTETDYFRHLGWLLRARGVISSDPACVRLLSAAGIPAVYWLPLAAPSPAASEDAPALDPLVAGLPRAARLPLKGPGLWSERPLDLMLAIDESEVRGEFVGRQADFLAALSCVIRYRRTLWRIPGEPLIDPDAADYIGRRCKLVLSLPEGEVGGLQPLAITHGMAQGALLVSAPALPHPLFESGIHYLEESASRLPQLIEWLLRSEDGQRRAEQVRTEASVRLAQVASPRRLAYPVVEMLSACCEQVKA